MDLFVAIHRRGMTVPVWSLKLKSSPWTQKHLKERCPLKTQLDLLISVALITCSSYKKMCQLFKKKKKLESRVIIQTFLHIVTQSCCIIFTTTSLYLASPTHPLAHTHTYKSLAHIRHVSALLFLLWSFLVISCWSLSSDSILSFARTICTQIVGTIIKYTVPSNYRRQHYRKEPNTHTHTHTHK